MSIMEKGVDWVLWESAPPLQSVKTKYLAVSPVTDNSERQDFEAIQEFPHPNFLKMKTWRVNKGLLCVHN
jgi:hypothetical protein